MNRDIFKFNSPVSRLMFALFITLSSFAFFMLIAYLTATVIFNLSFSELQQAFNSENPNNIPVIKYFQVMQSIGLFIIPAILTGFLFYSTNEDKLGLKSGTPPKFISVVLSCAILLCSIPLINIVAELNSKLQLPQSLSGLENLMQNTEKEAQRLTEAFLNVQTIGGLLFNIFMIGILPALGEEFLFRGIIQRTLIETTRNIHLGIILSAFFFSFLHFQFYGFIPRLLLGVLFGYLFAWSNNIWLPVISHFLNNSFAVVVYYFMNKGVIDRSVENIGAESNTIYYLLISVVVLSVLLYKLYSLEKKTNDVLVL